MRRKNKMPSADWQQFRRLMVYLRPHIGRFTIAMIAIVIGSILGLAGPYTLQYLIDAVFTQNNPQLLNQITVILIIIFALQAVFYFIRAYQLQYIGERVMIDLRLNLFQHLQKLSLSFYNERRTGELVSRATNDVSTVRTLVTSDVSTAISQVITFFGALILILITDWHLTLFMLMLVPMVVIVALLFGRRLRKISSAVQDQLADATTVLEEVLGGVRVVQSFTREDYEIGRYRNSIEQTFTLALKRIKLSATFGPVASFMGFAVVIAVFWFGGMQVLNGTLTAGQLTMFLILTLTIAGSIGSFSGLWTSLQEALGATKRIFEILDTPSDIVDRPEAKALPRIEGHIVLDRRGEDDAGQFDPALLRSPIGWGMYRRAGYSIGAGEEPAGADRLGAAGYLALRRHGAREHLVRQTRCDGRRIDRSRARGQRPRVHHPAKQGLRNHRGRTWRKIERWAASAHRDRTGYFERSPHPGAGRGHFIAR
jgi:ABC-type bacteriocin/lantibiotic exporter with double-glycine peptidase domain